MTVEDARARRAAVLFEVAAIADRYEMDTAPPDDEERLLDLIDTMNLVRIQPVSRSSLLELAGQTVAWLENLEAAKQRS